MKINYIMTYNFHHYAQFFLHFERFYQWPAVTKRRPQPPHVSFSSLLHAVHKANLKASYVFALC